MAQTPAPRPWRCPRDHTCPATRAHDTYSAYRHGCRSRAARFDTNRYEKQRAAGINDPRRLPITGTARRLQALAAIGWDGHQLATRLGCSARMANQLRAAEHPLINVATARRVHDLYEQLWDMPGSSTRARRQAARRGWAPPMAWDDDALDDEHAAPATTCAASTDPDEHVLEAILAGRVTWTDLTDVDQEDVVGRLRRRGWELTDIAQRVGAPHDAVDRVNERLVTRARRARRRAEEAA